MTYAQNPNEWLAVNVMGWRYIGSGIINLSTVKRTKGVCLRRSNGKFMVYLSGKSWQEWKPIENETDAFMVWHAMRKRGYLMTLVSNEDDMHDCTIWKDLTKNHVAYQVDPSPARVICDAAHEAVKNE